MKFVITLVIGFLIIGAVIFMLPSLFKVTTVGVVVTSYDESRAAGADAKRVSDIRSLKVELDLYFEKFNSFPKELEDLKSTALYPDLFEDVPGDIYKQFSRFHYATKNGVGGKITEYHLGQSLESKPSSTHLTSDADFNSRGIGWLNGFDGDDSQSCGAGDHGKFCYDITVKK